MGNIPKNVDPWIKQVKGSRANVLRQQRRGETLWEFNTNYNESPKYFSLRSQWENNIDTA